MSLFDELWHTAKTKSQNKTRETYLKIVSRAKKAASRGKFYITRHEISNEVASLLMEQGLILTFHTERGYIFPHAYWRINWSKPPVSNDDKNEK